MSTLPSTVVSDKLIITHCHPGAIDGYDRDGNLWQCLPDLPLERVYRVPALAGLYQNGRCHRCGCPLRDGMIRGSVAYCDDCWEFAR